MPSFETIMRMIRKNKNAIQHLLCLFKKLLTTKGEFYTSPSPSTAEADTDIPVGVLYYFDGTDGSFPEGQAMVKTKQT